MAHGQIAIWNATTKELEEVESELQVENYWRQLEGTAAVYTLTDYAWVDADELADYAHEDLLEAGWEQLQLVQGPAA
jgi:hypothetical protein